MCTHTHLTSSQGGLQQTMYNGWKKCHGVKDETVIGPDGLVLHLYGGRPGTFGVSARHGDCWMLRYGRMNRKLEQRHAQWNVMLLMLIFVVYGDSAYPWKTHLRARHNALAGHPNKVQFDKEDDAMSSCRIIVEWDYGSAGTFFPYTVQSKKLKVMSGMPLREIYFCRVLLHNCYQCLYENKTSQRFECPPPSLAEYLSWV